MAIEPRRKSVLPAPVPPDRAVLDCMEEADRLLSKATTFQEVKKLSAGAHVLRDWVKQQSELGIKIQNRALYIALKADKRLAEMLAQPGTTRKQGQRDQTLQNVMFPPPTLADLGLTPIKAHRLRILHALPAPALDALFEQANQEGRELTQDAILKAARKAQQPALARVRALPPGTFDLILADPPWQTDFRRGTGRDTENHYPTMDLLRIKRVAVPMLSAPHCVLLLWAISSMLPEALEVLSAWGFEYKTSFVWVKGRPGTGYYWRAEHELLLLGTRGEPGAPPRSCRVPSALFARKRAHSQKPTQVYDMLEAMYPQATRLELFARAKRPGWTVWGAEAPEE